MNPRDPTIEINLEHFEDPRDAAIFSIAISLKRIADAMALSRASEAGLTPPEILALYRGEK